MKRRRSKKRINVKNQRRQSTASSSSEEEFEPASSEEFEPGSSSSGGDCSEKEEVVVDDRRKSPRAKAVRAKMAKPERESKLLWQVWEEENKKWVEERMKNPTVEVESVSEDFMEPSPEVVLPLLRFQKEWLAWAMKQEALEVRGGILADEMGMGKTIQAIALVLTARSLRNPIRSIQDNVASSSSALTLPVLRRVTCTLVICPVVAVIQWVGEIERYTKKGSTRVLVYHGPKRAVATYDFNQYDFVITTYSTIEGDYRKNVMPPKERCQYCNRMFQPDKLNIHLKYYCGPFAEKTEKQAKQVKKNKKGTGSRLQKPKLSEDPKDEGKMKNRKAQKDEFVPDLRKSILHSVFWERIILDEAHCIKDRHSNTARAVFALQSSYKWALSGTPLQNRVGELYSLIHFLQIYPYSFYLCKDCDCKILDPGSTKDCVECLHSRVRHFCWWNRCIAKPIQDAGCAQDGSRAMILLKERVLKTVVLRRTKKGRAADLALPPRLVTLRRDNLDRREKEFYDALFTQTRIQFESYVTAGSLMNNYAHIFDLLTRLRQAVDHPYLVVYSKSAEAPSDTLRDNCGICHDPAEDMVVTSCTHVFCKTCLLDFSAALGNISCPSCSKPLTVDLTGKTNSSEMISKAVIKGYKHSGILNRIQVTDFKSSTKIDALKEEIRNMVEGDRSAKGIVFSQFTAFLDLINFSLQRSGVKCVQLVGSMTLAEREKAIEAFTNDADCKIFLMSLKAGGVALNLTVASHVFLMDPWWNPAVECQAQDRIHRIGQYKPIRTIRFVIENSVEERILNLQAKKQLVFEGTVGQSSEAISKLTEADLRFLFQV